MKKYVIVLIILLTGCSKTTTICESHINNSEQNYKENAKYTIYSKNNFVKKVSINEQYKSEDSNVIDYFDSYLKLTFLTLNEQYGNIEYKSKQIKNGIQYFVDIDFENTNIKEMVKNGYLDKDYVVNNQITTLGIKKMYESQGAKCN